MMVVNNKYFNKALFPGGMGFAGTVPLDFHEKIRSNVK